MAHRLTMEKIQSCLQCGNTKANVQSFCSILNFSPVQHAANLACVPSCNPLMCCGMQAPAWSLCVQSTGPWVTWLLEPYGHGEISWVHHASLCHQVRERKREREGEREMESASLFPWGYMSQACKIPEIFSTWLINCPGFCRLLIGPSPS